MAGTGTQPGRAWYADKRGRRSVALFDDRYIREREPQEEADRRSQELVEQVAEALRAVDLIVLPKDMFSTLGGLLVGADEPWNQPHPAPSLWVMDIDIPLGRGLADDIGDGVGVARLIRQRNITRPNSRGQGTPVPIVFLSRFDLDDTVPCERDPLSSHPIRRRLELEVGTAWYYCRKNLTGCDPAITEQPDGTPWSVQDFAQEMRKLAHG